MRATISINNIKKLTFCLFFVILISFPFVYKELKIIILVVLLLFAIGNFRQYVNTPISRNLLFVFSFYILSNCFFIILGIINRNIGVWPTFPVNFLWPVLYLIILFDARFYITINDVDAVFKISFIIILLYIIAYYMHILFGFSNIVNSELVQHSIDYTDRNATKNLIFIPAATSMFFLVPYFMTKVLISKEIKVSDYILLFCGIMISLATGRRALIVLVFASPVMIFFLSIVLPYRSKSVIILLFKKIVIISIILFSAVFILEKNKIIDVKFLITKTVSYFIPTKAGLQVGAIIRDNQQDALIEKWKQRPILGFGYGAITNKSIRNPVTPWSYESTYYAKLMNIGIVGVSIFIFYITYLIWQLSLGMKNNYVFYLASITGFITVLIANSTNPYLDSFEYMWMIYFQVLIILILDKSLIKPV